MYVQYKRGELLVGYRGVGQPGFSGLILELALFIGPQVSAHIKICYQRGIHQLPPSKMSIQ